MSKRKSASFTPYFTQGDVDQGPAAFLVAGQNEGYRSCHCVSTIVAVVLTILAAVAGDQFNVMSNIGGLPQIPVDANALTTSGLIALAIAVLIPLLAAILNGKAGMHFHRKVDQARINHQIGLNS